MSVGHDQAANHLHQLPWGSCHVDSLPVPIPSLLNCLVQTWPLLKAFDAKIFSIAPLLDSEKRYRARSSVGIYVIVFFARQVIHVTSSQNAYSAALMGLLALFAPHEYSSSSPSLRSAKWNRSSSKISQYMTIARQQQLDGKNSHSPLPAGMTQALKSFWNNFVGIPMHPQITIGQLL